MISLMEYHRRAFDMKKLFAMVAIICPVLFLAGCEPFDSDDEDAVEFVNKSRYRVTVIPQARSGWSGFSLAPGEHRKLNDTYDVFFTYEPRFRVEIGKNEDGRVLFINAAGAIEAGGE
jgi:hypothetical protein